MSFKLNSLRQVLEVNRKRFLFALLHLFLDTFDFPSLFYLLNFDV